MMSGNEANIASAIALGIGYGFGTGVLFSLIIKLIFWAIVQIYHMIPRT